MKFLQLLAIFACLSLALSLPVTKEKKKEEKPKPEEDPSVQGLDLEYERYLKEVVEALESDQDFRKKLENASESDIRTGKVAQELDYVSHHVRTKLDEIKRREVHRLRELASKEYEIKHGIDREHMKVSAHHLDHTNEHTFEIRDLEKLIKKTHEDLTEADKKRREEFKQYELQKEYEKNAIEKEMDDESKNRYEEDLKKKKEKHNKHEKLHQPGNKAQLEEVWEKQDHMDPDEFNPVAFFMMHDVDSNGYWDEAEVKALFIKELDKVYENGVPEDDMRERAEEMERMREHMFRKTDLNQDGLISMAEFIDSTKREEFNRDQEWETVDNQPQFTHDEYLEFERKRQEEIQKMIAQGLLPAHPQMPYGYHSNGQPNVPPQHMPPPHYQQYPQSGAPVPLHPNQVYNTQYQQPQQGGQQQQYQQPQQGGQQQQYSQQHPGQYQQQQQPVVQQQQYQQSQQVVQQQQYQQPQQVVQQQQYQQPQQVVQQQPQQVVQQQPAQAAPNQVPQQGNQAQNKPAYVDNNQNAKVQQNMGNNQPQQKQPQAHPNSI